MVAVLLQGACSAPLDRAGQWRADLAFLARKLPSTHPDFYNMLPKETFDQAVDALEAELTHLPDYAIVVRLAQLVAMAGDSHTVLNPLQGSRDRPRFPLDLYWFEDGLRVIRAAKDKRHLIGARLAAIDGVPVDVVLAKISTTIPAENDAIIKNIAPARIVSAEILHALEITESLNEAVFAATSDDGGQVAERLGSVKRRGNVALTSFAGGRDYNIPLYLARTKALYWAKGLPDSRAVYVQYNKCRNDRLYSFRRFSRDVLELADAQQAERLVIDLRRNGGGNSAVAGPLIRALRGHDVFGVRGHLFVIIGRRTFSSALLNALSLQDQCQAILVGEPTGGKPNHFGEVRVFKLPYSKLAVQHSTRYFEVRPGDDSPSLEPELWAPPTWQALVSGQDPALEVCLGWVEPGAASPTVTGATAR